MIQGVHLVCCAPVNDYNSLVVLYWYHLPVKSNQALILPSLDKYNCFGKRAQVKVLRIQDRILIGRYGTRVAAVLADRHHYLSCKYIVVCQLNINGILFVCPFARFLGSLRLPSEWIRRNDKRCNEWCWSSIGLDVLILKFEFFMRISMSYREFLEILQTREGFGNSKICKYFQKYEQLLNQKHLFQMNLAVITI